MRTNSGMDRSQGILICVMTKPKHGYFQEHEFDEDQPETQSLKVRDANAWFIKSSLNLFPASSLLHCCSVLCYSATQTNFGFPRAFSREKKSLRKTAQPQQQATRCPKLLQRKSKIIIIVVKLLISSILPRTTLTNKVI